MSLFQHIHQVAYTVQQLAHLTALPVCANVVLLNNTLGVELQTHQMILYLYLLPLTNIL